MKQARGFTLIELAIVLVIVTILIGGLAVPLSAQIQARRIAETNRTLDEAKEAIIGYALGNTCTNKCVAPDSSNFACANGGTSGTECSTATCNAVCATLPTNTSPAAVTTTLKRHYLPCPSHDGTGIEAPRNNDGECASCADADKNGYDDSTGKPCNLLPWATLGTADKDAWGNRLHYSVTSVYANSKEGFYSGGPTADLNVCAKSTTPCEAVAAGVPAVILSHGNNGWGALNMNNNVLAVPIGSDEITNIETPSITVGSTTHVTHVTRPPYKPVSNTATERAKEFDDQLVWISSYELNSRICSNGGCP
jgi:prepilin-type N-terminal cleavage/methylation domain-containing protein